jgi:nitrite reductase/ring-hydroxylating ferredoxin subunit
MIRTEFPKLPKKNADRVKGQIYINNKNEIVKLYGKYLKKMCRCGKIPNFNYEGKTTAICCSSCKTPEMVDVVNNRCEHEGCQKRPAFNVQGQKKRRFCGVHKLDGMVDVVSNRCEHEGCQKRPAFNVQGQKKGRFCREHKLDGMVDVTHDRCEHEGCQKRPNFNMEGQKKGRFCGVHKLDGMVDVVNNRCEHEGCQIQPNFNMEGQKKGRFCGVHKLDGMVDVVSNRCEHEGCQIQPNFNMEGQKKGRFCGVHKLDGMVDVKNKKCKQGCNTQCNNDKYDGYCLRCFMYLFPDKPVSRNYKTKEFAVVEYVTTEFPDVDWVADKIVNGGCSKRRPDLLLDLGYQVIIIEVDENQHNGYTTTCEIARVNDLYTDLGDRPIIFIRFNPDDYVNAGGSKITSCWGTDGNGICVVKKSKKKEWTQRLNWLKEPINYWINPENKTNKMVETVELCYDGWN